MKKNYIISLRVSAIEKAKIKEQAGKLGLSTSDLLRYLLTNLRVKEN